MCKVCGGLDSSKTNPIIHCGSHGSLSKGCGKGWHLLCLGQESLPRCDWFCATCRSPCPPRGCEVGESTKRRAALLESSRDEVLRVFGLTRTRLALDLTANAWQLFCETECQPGLRLERFLSTGGLGGSAAADLRLLTHCHRAAGTGRVP